MAVGSRDLFAKFTLKTGFANLKAELEVRRTATRDLKAIVGVVHWEDLFADFKVSLGTITQDLKAEFEVGQGAVVLKATFNRITTSFVSQGVSAEFYQATTVLPR